MNLITKVCIVVLTIPLFFAGWLTKHVLLIEGSKSCVDKIIKNKQVDRMKSYYGHKNVTEMHNVYNHAEALYEKEWAKCFREELYK